MKYTLDIKKEAYNLLNEVSGTSRPRVEVLDPYDGNLPAGLITLHREAQLGQFGFTILPKILLDEGPTAIIRESFRQERVLAAIVLPQELGTLLVENAEGRTQWQSLALILSHHENETVVGRKNMLLSTQIYEGHAFSNKLLSLESQEYLHKGQNVIDGIRYYLKGLLEGELQIMDDHPAVSMGDDEEVKRLRDFCKENNGQEFLYLNERVTLNFDEPTDSVAFVVSGKEGEAVFHELEEMESDIQYLIDHQHDLVYQEAMRMAHDTLLLELQEKKFDTPLSSESSQELMQVQNSEIKGSGDKWEPIAPLYCYIEDDVEGYRGYAKVVEVVRESYGGEDGLSFYLTDLDHNPHEIFDFDKVLFSREDARRLQAMVTGPISSTDDGHRSEIVDNQIQKPIFDQFENLKGKHPDAHLLFRSGGQYVCYQQDAERLTEVLGYTLSNRPVEGKKGGVGFVSFPCQDLDTVLPRLIRSGLRVAICDQLEMASQSLEEELEKNREGKIPEGGVAPSTPMYNLYTNEHGDSDHSWDDYIDFVPGEGLRFSTNDWTYGAPENRDHVLPSIAMAQEEAQEARMALTQFALLDDRLSAPSSWIGSSQPRDFKLKCRVKGSKKYNGQARLMSIGSKHDRFGREVYYAYIFTPQGKNYQISPKCITPSAHHLSLLLEKMETQELACLVDELKHGHWNYPGYNRHLFRWPEYLAKYAVSVSEQIKQEEHIVTTVQDLTFNESNANLMQVNVLREQGGRQSEVTFEVDLKAMGLRQDDEFEMEFSKDIQRDTVEFYKEHEALPTAQDMRELTEQHYYDMGHDLKQETEQIPEEINVAKRRWLDDIAIHHADYVGASMEMRVSRDGHVFFRDPEEKDFLMHEYYFRTPKEILTRQGVAEKLKREGITSDQLLDMMLKPELASQCYEMLCNYNITDCRMDRGILIEGEEMHDDISDARHLWSRDIVEAGCTHYDYDSDLSCNESFISPQGDVFVYYPDAKEEYWENEMFSHYKFPDFREMSSEDIVERLNEYHDEHSIFRAYDVDDINRFREKGGDWTCALLEDVMMCTELDKLEQTHYLEIVRELPAWADFKLEKSLSNEEQERDYNMLNLNESNLMQDYKRQNNVELTGYIVSTPEFKTLPNSGKDVMTFNMALRTGDNRQLGPDGKPESKSLLIRVEKYLVEGDREKFASFCEKARTVTVSGFVAGQEKYTNHAGTKVNTLRIIAHDMKSYVKAAEGEQSNFRNSLTVSGRLTKDIAWVGKDSTKLNANLAYFSAKEGESDPKFFLSMSKFMKPEQKEALLPLLNPNQAIKVEGWLEAVEFTNKEGTLVNTFNFVPKTIEKAEVKEQAQEGIQEKPAITVNREELKQQYAEAMESMRQEGVNPETLSDAQLNRIFVARKATDLTTETGVRKNFQLQRDGDTYDIKSSPVKPKVQEKDVGAEM